MDEPWQSPSEYEAMKEALLIAAANPKFMLRFPDWAIKEAKEILILKDLEKSIEDPNHQATFESKPRLPLDGSRGLTDR